MQHKHAHSTRTVSHSWFLGENCPSTDLPYRYGHLWVLPVQRKQLGQRRRLSLVQKRRSDRHRKPEMLLAQVRIPIYSFSIIKSPFFLGLKAFISRKHPMTVKAGESLATCPMMKNSKCEYLQKYFFLSLEDMLLLICLCAYPCISMNLYVTGTQKQTVFVTKMQESALTWEGLESVSF